MPWERWVSAERFSVYLHATGGDRRHARDLYLSDVALCGAFTEDLHLLELVMRNHIDRVMADAFPSHDWLTQPGVLIPGGHRKVREAQDTILRHGRVVNHGRLVAGLSSGFWAALFGRPYDELWRQATRQAVAPDGPRSRKDVIKLLERVRKLRNRVAHHETLTRVDIEGRARDITTATTWFDAEAGLIPSAHAIEQHAATAGLQVTSWHHFGADYAETLHRWRAQFIARWPMIRSDPFSDDFRRTWEFYFAYCEAGFRTCYLDVAQMRIEPVVS